MRTLTIDELDGVNGGCTGSCHGQCGQCTPTATLTDKASCTDINGGADTICTGATVVFHHGPLQHQ